MTLVNTSAKVRKIDVSIDAVALFDVLLIAVMMVITTSKFILSTGMTIDLSSDFLPTMSAPDSELPSDDVNVLTAAGNSMLIFEGEISTVKSFAHHLAASKQNRSRTVLLVKAEKNIDSQTLIDICQAAKAGGFKKVQIAAKPSVGTK